MTTDNSSQDAKNTLIHNLKLIAISPADGIDGATRINAAVMAAYLSGLPVPTDQTLQNVVNQMERKFGIELFTNS